MPAQKAVIKLPAQEWFFVTENERLKQSTRPRLKGQKVLTTTLNLGSLSHLLWPSSPNLWPGCYNQDGDKRLDVPEFSPTAHWLRLSSHESGPQASHQGYQGTFVGLLREAMRRGVPPFRDRLISNKKRRKHAATLHERVDGLRRSR